MVNRSPKAVKNPIYRELVLFERKVNEAVKEREKIHQKLKETKAGEEEEIFADGQYRELRRFHNKLCNLLHDVYITHIQPEKTSSPYI